MGREVRRVPADWNHPKDGRVYRPLYGHSFAKRLAEWEEGKAQWDRGYESNCKGGWEPKKERDYKCSYDDWDGPRPEEKDYMPDWPEVERTHYQMYETCTEGTPISPVMETPEKLARWLADNDASAFGDDTASYEAWLSTIKRGSSIGAVFAPGLGMMSGVEYEHKRESQTK
jgi:hypothetical protein